MYCPSSACGGAPSTCSPGACSGSFDESEWDEEDPVRKRAMIYRCPAGVCNLNASTATLTGYEEGYINNCRRGHGGRLCMVCWKNWALAAGKCIDCGEDGKGDQSVLYTVAIILGILVLAAWYFFAWRPLFLGSEQVIVGGIRNFAQSFKGTIKFSTEAEEKKPRKRTYWEKKLDNVRNFIDKNMSTATVKIIISFYQVGGSFTSTFAVDWPPQFVTLMTFVSSLFQFDILSFPGIACAAGTASFPT
eukprot:669349-Rhodomonas_salina.1